MGDQCASNTPGQVSGLASGASPSPSHGSTETGMSQSPGLAREVEAACLVMLGIAAELDMIGGISSESALRDPLAEMLRWQVSRFRQALSDLLEREGWREAIERLEYLRQEKTTVNGAGVSLTTHPDLGYVEWYEACCDWVSGPHAALILNKPSE